MFAISDLHVDFSENRAWVAQLSSLDFTGDLLICAGDISHSMPDLGRTFAELRSRFAAVCFVPGNHELWVKQSSSLTSLQKFEKIEQLTANEGVSTEAVHLPDVSVVPLHGWYDFSFGEPSPDLLGRWADFQLCRWPEGLTQTEITQCLLSRNERYLVRNPMDCTHRVIISFSHFVPRTDLLPANSAGANFLRPVLGCHSIESQIRKLGSSIHVYGHYHVNNRRELNGVTYINNAFGYPRETAFSAKRLLCIL
ncbi:MAG TPA: metallophosphoesterase, partial [Candidatus Angelobacter sp.]|nr:metallophosphoesterase [Candidatus Angelobacter sp.]